MALSVGQIQMKTATRYWLEAGTILHFEKQPNKSHIPKWGQYYVSTEVVRAEDHDAIVKKLHLALALANSMILSSEQHSPQSSEAISEALS